MIIMCIELSIAFLPHFYNFLSLSLSLSLSLDSFFSHSNTETIRIRIFFPLSLSFSLIRLLFLIRYDDDCTVIEM